MSAFARLRATFSVSWTTVLVGWIGLGELSPWPDRWAEFPPLVSASELAAYAEERLAMPGSATEQQLTVSLLSLLGGSAQRQTVRKILTELSNSMAAIQHLNSGSGALFFSSRRSSTYRSTPCTRFGSCPNSGRTLVFHRTPHMKFRVAEIY